MTIQEMQAEIIQADSSAIFSLDGSDLWEAIEWLVSQMVERMTDDEIKERYSAIFDDKS